MPSTRVEAQIFAGCCLALAIHLLIDAFVDVRPGTSLTDHLVSGTVPVVVLALLAVALNPALAILTMAVFADSLPPAPIPDVIAEIAPRPVMLIWGPPPEANNTMYFARAGEPKTIWHTPESEHGGGIEARPEEYERRVIGFFDDALLASSQSR